MQQLEIEVGHKYAMREKVSAGRTADPGAGAGEGWQARPDEGASALRTTRRDLRSGSRPVNSSSLGASVRRS